MPKNNTPHTFIISKNDVAYQLFLWDGCGLNFRGITLVKGLSLFEIAPGVFSGFGLGRFLLTLLEERVDWIPLECPCDQGAWRRGMICNIQNFITTRVIPAFPLICADHFHVVA